MNLKELKLSHERIKTGRLFQSSGAETAKAREPYDFRWKLVGLRSNKCGDRRILEGWWYVAKSWMSTGDCWWRALKLINIILNLMRSETGSQNNSFSIGVMWSYFREQVISRPAAFWTHWSLFKTHFGAHLGLFSKLYLMSKSYYGN